MEAVAERLLKGLLEPHREAMDEVIGEVSGWLVWALTIAIMIA